MLQRARPQTPAARPEPRPRSARGDAAGNLDAAELSPSNDSSRDVGRSLQRREDLPARALAETDIPLPAQYELRDLMAVAELARHYLTSGALRVALALFEGLSAVAPDVPYFAIGLAVTYGELGRRKEADAEYERAEKLDPSDGRPDINRAELLLADGDRARARVLLVRGAKKARNKKDSDLERKACALLARLDTKAGK